MFTKCMARDIKAIECPKCGSTSKEEVKTDFYRCQNCWTEYFLDSDDTHIYYHHQQIPPPVSSSAPSSKLPGYILKCVFVFIAVACGLVLLLQPKNKGYNANAVYKAPRSYISSYVYTNTATGDPVYLRIGVDYIDKGNKKSEQEVHAQFNNAIDGKLLADRILTDESMRNRCSLSFRVYSTDLVYGIGCNSALLQLDSRNNRLAEVTSTVFKDFPKLSSGVAKLDFDYNKPAINVMNNEGESFFYFPTIKKLAATEEQANTIWKEIYKAKRYFEFGYMGDYFDDNKPNQLIKVEYLNGQFVKRDITPGRKYFAPAIIYQDQDNLIIAVNTTAAPDPPMSIQKIDVNTGKILWALPPDKFYLSNVVKCKQGYAIEYRKGEEADYVHGVLVVSNSGKLEHDYQLSRTE